METLAVANNVVVDNCSYLRQAAITDDGLYWSVDELWDHGQERLQRPGHSVSGSGVTGGNQ